MTSPSRKVVPIRHSEMEEIVELAFAYWRERLALQNGSPEEDLLRAHTEVRGRSARCALFLVPKQP